MTGVRRSLNSDAGSIVEFTGILPLLLVTVVVLVWESFLLGMSATYAGHAANEGARTAAVNGGYNAVKASAVQRISGVWADEDTIDVIYPGGTQCDDIGPRHPDCGYVRVTIEPPLIFPGAVLPMKVSARTRVVYEGVG